VIAGAFENVYVLGRGSMALIQGSRVVDMHIRFSISDHSHAFLACIQRKSRMTTHLFVEPYYLFIMTNSNRFNQLLSEVCPPAPILVGIEPNPGPPKRSKQTRSAQKNSDHKNVNKALGTTIQTVKGRGGYFEDAAKKGGSWLGNKIGGMAGRLFETVTGLGDYSVPESKLGNSPPIFNSKGAPIIEHREFLGDITGSTAFTITSYPLNPGMRETFPWLYSQANNFEEYRLLGCIFEFKSTSASALNSTNTALGTVVLATEYDSYDLPFSNKTEMENHTFSCSAPPNISQLHAIECKPNLTVAPQRWVRVTDAPDGADLRLYDWGRFNIATVGQQAAAVIGELWVTYRIQLLKPTMNPVGSDVHFSRYITLPAGAQTNFNAPFVTALFSNPSTDNTFSLTRVTDFTFSFPKSIRSGLYMIVVNTVATASWTCTASAPIITNCTLIDSNYSPANTFDTTSWTGKYIVNITGESATFNTNLNSVTLTGAYTDLTVVQLPNLALTARKKAPGLIKLNQRIAKLEKLLLDSSVNYDDDFKEPITYPTTTELSQSTIDLARTIKHLIPNNHFGKGA
jgi:hypothetical protein